MVAAPGRRFFILTAVALLLAAGCTGPRQGRDATPPAPRTGNVDIVLLSFGSVQGELLECG